MLSVAVIEDDIITLDLITCALEAELDATVYSFNRSKLARDFLLQQTPDSLNLVISDQSMPDYDGLSLLKLCRAKGLDIPFLLISADPDKAIVLAAAELKVAGFLVKPIRIAELVATSNKVATA